jgi:hypothetical protein
MQTHDKGRYTPGVLSGRPLAFVLLAWSLLRIIAKTLTGRVTGLVQFHRNYAAEQLAPISKDERRTLAQFSSCIACGRCDVGEANRISESNGEYPGLMQLVLASTRNIPDYDAAARGFAHVPEEELDRKVNRCPVRFPFSQLASFVRKKTSQDGSDRDA